MLAEGFSTAQRQTSSCPPSMRSADCSRNLVNIFSGKSPRCDCGDLRFLSHRAGLPGTALIWRACLSTCTGGARAGLPQAPLPARPSAAGSGQARLGCARPQAATRGDRAGLQTEPVLYLVFCSAALLLQSVFAHGVGKQGTQSYKHTLPASQPRMRCGSN